MFFIFIGSEFGDKNLKTISKAIKTHGDLKKIQLQLCIKQILILYNNFQENSQISGQGLKVLAEAFRSNDKVKQVELNVENTNLGPEAAKEIILAFKNNSAISSAIFNFSK